MDISWDDAQTFLAVAEHQSFSAAARVLGLGQATISRRIAEAEQRLGCQLFRRGKRGAELTADGARLLPAAEQMARWATEFDRLARGAEEDPSGTVRIAAPPGLAVELFAPFARLVRARWPRIVLEVLASIDHVDLSRGAADLAIRTRAPQEPELTTLRSERFDLAVFGSREYRASLPPRPGLGDLAWVTWAFPYEHVAPRPLLERLIPGFEPVFASDSYLVQKSAVAAGMGAMVLERVQHPVAHQAPLVEIEVDLELPRGEFHLVCAKSMQSVPRVRAVADLVVAEFDTWVGGGASS
jgi:DNA-binding transcriptional LysR family regulator